jgi:legumain
MASSLMALGASAAENYAVLVAGSSGYYNYRHQADVCHAYQVVLAHGIPAENIITMAYDDIANNSQNPFPGQMFNKPTAAGTAGQDVYAGCKIDYSGSDVNSANFKSVLTGTATGKNLKSTSEDNVFIFFSDHGGAGLICFPSDDLHKADLQTTLDTMHSNNMYKKLVFYLETCESGSMFEGLSTPGVYAVSAANPTESSWGTYCGNDAMVDGKSIGSCLGDLFSVSWMEDSDVADLTAESLMDQFTTVHTRTSKSEVMQWGELDFLTDKVSEYQGAKSTAAIEGAISAVPVSARQVDLQQVYFNYVNAETSQKRLAAGAELQKILVDQLAVETAYENFLNIVYPSDAQKQAQARESNLPADNRNCELATRESFKSHGVFDSYSGFALQFHKYIVNVCADTRDTNIDLVEAAKQACSSAVTMV